ncbi:hypothetical protein L7F22_020706 [Adiantum nelumboides]|nr:hypothetical protein [Adiantum nelumboides]
MAKSHAAVFSQQDRPSGQLNEASSPGIEAAAAITTSPAGFGGRGARASPRGGGRGAGDLKRANRHSREEVLTISASADRHSSSAPAILLHGRVFHLNVSSGYGFLKPTISLEDHSSANPNSVRRVSSSPAPITASIANKADTLCSGSSSPGVQEVPNVYFKLPPTKLESHSSCYSGLMSLKHGDTLEYISDSSSQKPRAIYTRLIACSSRSVEDMASYLKCLLFHCLQDGCTDAVLREVIKAPRGLLLMLEHPDPDQALIFLILKLALAICDHYKVASLNTSRVKDFLRILIHSPFFMAENGGLCKLLLRLKISATSGDFSATIEFEWGRPLPTLITSVKSLVLQILGHIPQELPYLVCLIQMLDQMLMVNLNPEINSKPLVNLEGSFAMQVIQQVAHASGVGLGCLNVSYDKLSLLPSDLEIKSSLDRNNTRTSVGLPVAKWKGAYDSTEEYIDTYFRLLREDSFASLIKGISDFLNDKLDHRDMTVWYGVSATGVRFQQYLPGLMVGLQLNYDQANRRRPKLPLAGSLLCICDKGGHFENPLWAIAARSVETSNKTVVLFVEVLMSTLLTTREQSRSTSSWGRILQASNMVVAESPAYYRAYEPVLKALQCLDPETMPFQSELAKATSPRKPPNYLNETTILDWSCLKAQDSYGELKAGVNELVQPTLSGFQTCLDSSQVKAVNHVLQNQLAMIQGPPGTGKTFLSVRIVELLLSANTRPHKPVLIVTYKNRALDQLLGSCLRFCEPQGIVRVGGRSTEPKLDCCNLQFLLRTAERKFTSEWISNCKKLENLQIDLSRALCKLYKCQAASMETILCQGLLSRSQSRNDTKSAPDEHKLTTAELSNDALKDSDTTDILKTKQHKTLKEWMPRKGIFDAIKGRFTRKLHRSPKNESSKLKSTANDDQEEPDELEEDDEERNESESLWQDIKDANRPGLKGKKEIDWLNNNYLNLADFDLENKLFLCQSLANFDSTPFTWLLEEDPFKLSEELRCILILVIMKQNFEACTEDFLELKSQYDAVCAENVEINNQKRVAILQEAKIIGMTTTGAAINQDIIATVSPSIILVEEAAEILEPHVMALLSSNVEHLILIGDHKQLRPSVDCYQLETKHNLGISMLERLVENNGLPYQTLGLQSRMREEFLQMIKPIYPNLRSNLKVVNGTRNRPAKCMGSTMYFWKHTVEETMGRSPSNLREAHMVVALSKWLLSEGHTHEEITVICAYNGQVALPSSLSPSFTLRKVVVELEVKNVVEEVEIGVKSFTLK